MLNIAKTILITHIIKFVLYDAELAVSEDNKRPDEEDVVDDESHV